METDKALRHKIASLLKSERFAVLSTVSKDQPYANLVAFVEDEDLKTLYFATDQGTRKFENIKANNRIALLVENSTNSDFDINGAEVATIIGRATVAGNNEKEILIQKYLNKHPYLEQFIRSTGCKLIKLKVNTYVFVENFQQSHILKMD